MRAVPDIAISFAAEREAFRAKAYPDPATGGDPWTIGYGHTGPAIHDGLVWTEPQARATLSADLSTAALRLYQRVGDVVNMLTENQYSALLSFVLNVGADPKWTIWKRLLAHEFDQIPGELMRFVNAGGRKMQGLVNRRAEEVKLWSTDEPGSTPETPPSSVTRAIDTPPTATVTKPLHQSNSFIATVATAIVATAGPFVGQAQGAIKSISDAVSPYVGQSEILQHLQGTLTMALAGLAVTAVVLEWLKHREAKSQ